MHTIESQNGLELEKTRAEAVSLVAKSIQNSSHSLDLNLHVILTGITAGESLGFSRAILFEGPEGKSVLRVRAAIGHTTLESARESWEGGANRIGRRTTAQR